MRDEDSATIAIEIAKERKRKVRAYKEEDDWIKEVSSCSARAKRSQEQKLLKMQPSLSKEAKDLKATSKNALTKENSAKTLLEQPLGR